MSTETKKLRELANAALAHFGDVVDTFAYSLYLDAVRHPGPILGLLDEIERLERARAGWESDARVYAQNADYANDKLASMTAARDELADIAGANTPNTDPHDSFAEVRDRIASLRKVGAP